MRWTALLFAIATLAVALFFGDRVGWEGDDLAAMFGISYLDVLGRDVVYRYAWQPLSYEVLHALGDFGIRFLRLTYVANVAGMVGLTLLAVLLGTTLGRRTPSRVLLAFVLAAMFPEVWITSMYFNTTAIALPFFVCSLLALRASEASARPNALIVASGCAFAISCLFRLDFAAAGVFLPLMVRAATGRWRSALIWVLAAACIPALFAGLQPEWLQGAWRVIAGYEEGQRAWGFGQSIKVLFLTCGPAVLILPILLMGIKTRVERSTLLWQCAIGLSLIPMCLPLKNLYSGKYLIPLICCVLWLLARHFARRAASDDLPRHWNQRLGAAVLVLVLAVFFTPTPDRPVGEVGLAALTKPRPANTHDGLRTAGAYFELVRLFDSPHVRPPYLDIILQMARMVATCNANVTIRYPDNQRHYVNDPWNWGWLPLHLVSKGWRLEQFTPPDKAELQSPGGLKLRMLAARQVDAAVPDSGWLLDLGAARALPGDDDATTVLRYLQSDQVTQGRNAACGHGTLSAASLIK